MTVCVYARLPPPIVYKGTEQAHKKCLFSRNIQRNPHLLVQFV